MRSSPASSLGSLLAVAVAVVALAMLLSSPARADIFHLSYDETAVDPAEAFDADCLGETPAADCDVRSALIEAELVALLSRLENDEDPATLALFRSALQLDSPVVQGMAVRYLSRSDEKPTDFLSTVKTFFWGPDAPLGVASASALEMSENESEQRLAELYGEQRSSSNYATPPIRQDETTEVENELLQACTQDTRLELMLSFAEEEQFAPAQRLLMYDRFVSAAFQPTEDYPVTTFLTEASVEDVSAFFGALFGEPHAQSANNEQRLQELTEQLVELQSAAAGGDQKAIAELSRVAEELAALQEEVTLAGLLGLRAIHAENDLVFLDGTLDDLYTGPVRAVTVGRDELLGGTVIRYINAPSGQQSPGPSDGDAGAPGDQEPGGDGGASSGSVPRSSDGCGCAVPGRSSAFTELGLLPFLAWLARRRRQWGSRPSHAGAPAAP
jgi:hypothetical protein